MGGDWHLGDMILFVRVRGASASAGAAVTCIEGRGNLQLRDDEDNEGSADIHSFQDFHMLQSPYHDPLRSSKFILSTYLVKRT